MGINDLGNEKLMKRVQEVILLNKYNCANKMSTSDLGTILINVHT
jgi:hypothetical protein